MAAILLVRLVGQPPKNVKNEICPHRCFAFYTRTARLNVQLPCKYIRIALSENPRDFAYKRQNTGVFLNRTIFDGLTVSKMASIFVAPLHGSTQAILNKNMPIHNYRHRNKQNTASLSFASRFEAEEHHVNKPGRTARRPTSCTAYTR